MCRDDVSETHLVKHSKKSNVHRLTVYLSVWYLNIPICKYSEYAYLSELQQSQ